MIKQVLEGDGLTLFFLMFLTYMKKNGGNLINLACHSNIGLIFAPSTIINCQSVVKIKIKNKIEKMKGEYQCPKSLSKKQTRKNESTWPWFVRMIIFMEDLAKGEDVPKGVMKVLELEKMKMSYWNLTHSCLSF